MVTAPALPPPHEVRLLWDRCMPVSEELAAIHYLMGRRIDPVVVQRENLARVLPRKAPCPRWARTSRGDWEQTGHRLIVPVYRAGWLPGDGPTLLRAWSWSGAKPARLSASSCGGRCRCVRGLAMANRLGQSVLAWFGVWGPMPRGLVIVEGEPDYLTACCAWPDWAVLGITSGAWTDGLARTVPHEAVVVVRTDADAAGDRYAAQIAESLRGRATVLRVRCPGADVNDLRRADRLPADPRRRTK